MSTETELRAVLEEFRTVLGLAEDWNDPDADFFELGGSSLEAAELSERLEAALGREITLDIVFEHSTPRAVVAALGE